MIIMDILTVRCKMEGQTDGPTDGWTDKEMAGWMDG